MFIFNFLFLIFIIEILLCLLYLISSLGYKTTEFPNLLSFDDKDYLKFLEFFKEEKFFKSQKMFFLFTYPMILRLFKKVDKY